MAFNKNCSPELNIEDLSDIFTDSFFLSTEEINEIYMQTTEQSNSDGWKSPKKEGWQHLDFLKLINVHKIKRTEN